MKVFVAKDSGFCFGVKRAMDLAYKYAAGEPVRKKYSLNEIIHNPQEVKKLEDAGVKHVDNIKDIEDCSSVVVSTHGITPAEERLLREKKLEILDTTCPFVKRIHLIARKLSGEGYQVIIAGDREHLEVRGILGYTAGRDGKITGTVVNKPGDVKGALRSPKIGVVAQTTYSLDRYKEITHAILTEAFRRGYAEVNVHNTICDATQNRQDATAALARKTDVMVIVGGRNSANTRRLYSISRAIRKDTHHIESPGELKASWFKGREKVGLSAGASTPESAIRATLEKIEEIGRKAKDGKRLRHK